MSRSLRVTALSAALLGALTLSGCGDQKGAHEPTSTFGKQTAAQISEAVRSDMKGVRSVTIDGTTGEAKFHISLADDGSCVGTVEQYGGTAEVIESAAGSFVKADDAYWIGTAEGDAAAEKKVRKALGTWDGRWVRSPRGTGELATASYFLPQCQFATFVPALTAGDRTLATKGEEREVDGVEAVALTADQGDVQSTMWVSTDAPHRIVRLTQAGSDTVYAFSHYDEPVSIQTPDPDEVFDLAAANKKAE